MLLSFSLNDTYTAARFGSEYYIAVGTGEPSTVTGADEVIRAQTDYPFTVDVNPSLTVTDSNGLVLQKVVQSVFNVQFIAQLPPYIQL